MRCKMNNYMKLSYPLPRTSRERAPTRDAPTYRIVEPLSEMCQRQIPPHPPFVKGGGTAGNFAARRNFHAHGRAIGTRGIGVEGSGKVVQVVEIFVSAGCFLIGFKMSEVDQINRHAVQHIHDPRRVALVEAYPRDTGHQFDSDRGNA